MRRERGCGRLYRAAAAMLAGMLLVTASPEVYAKEEAQTDCLTFPVELYDFNADNVLFEYDLNSGLSLVTAENAGEGSVAKGLVESTLRDGKPVYTQAAVELAAKEMAEQLLSGYAGAPAVGDTENAYYKALKKKLVVEPQGTPLEKMFGEGAETNYFYENGWSAEGLASVGSMLAAPAEGKEQPSVVWHQDGDGVIGTDPAVPLVKSGIQVTADQTYTLRAWYVTGSMDVEILNGAGEPLTIKLNETEATKVSVVPSEAGDFCDIKFTAPVDGRITVRIAPSESAAQTGARMAAPTVSAGTETVDLSMGQNGSGWFYEKGWDVPDDVGASYTQEAGSVISGTPYWKQAGDGVLSLRAGKPLTRTVEVQGGQSYELAYYAGGDDYSFSGLELKVTDGNGTVLYQSGAAGNEVTDDTWNKPVFTVPESVSSLTLSITAPEEGEHRVAALSLTPLGGAALGDYDASKAKFSSDVDTFGVDSVDTCMDYCYYVMNHFFEAQKGLGTATDLYRTLVLAPVDEEGGHGFTVNFGTSELSEEEKDAYNVIYDKASGELRFAPNDPQGVNKSGFFPLDELEGGQKYEGIFYYKDTDGVKEEHNYHYSMTSHGTFIYHKDANLYFTFTGDDDTYLFVNNRLALDLGGAHLAASDTVQLNDCAEALGLVEGGLYSIDFFYMERHTDLSDFSIATNIPIARREEATPVSLLVDKRDAEDGSTLAGAQFALYSDAECKHEVARAVTDAYGTASFQSCLNTDSSYWLKEIQAPEGYVQKDTVYALDTAAAVDNVLTLVVKNDRAKADSDKPTEPESPETPENPGGNTGGQPEQPGEDGKPEHGENGGAHTGSDRPDDHKDSGSRGDGGDDQRAAHTPQPVSQTDTVEQAQTGDTAPTAGYLFSAALAAAGIATVYRKRKNRK